MLMKRLLKTTKITLNDGEIDRFAIHETGSQDGEYMPGEKVVKRLKTENTVPTKPTSTNVNDNKNVDN